MTTFTRILLIAVLSAVPFTAPAEDQPGFRYDGESFFGEDMPGRIRQQLYEMEMKMNRQREQLFDQFAVQQYIEERSEAEDKPVEQVQQELLGVPEPDPAAVRQFYDENRQSIGQPFEQVKGRIAEYIRQQQTQGKVDALVQRIKEEKGYAVALPEPRAPVFDINVAGYPSKGADDAAVTVVEFADYQCPYCKQATGVVDRLVERFGDRVRVVYRDFPVNRSGISREVAEGAVCADRQGSFWAYHDLAFERQDSLDTDSPTRLAEKLSLDMSEFESCLASDQPEAKVAKSQAEGVKLGVSGTPTFFVNGRQLHVHGDLEQPLMEAVETALAERSS